jgi:hypothetical protein
MVSWRDFLRDFRWAFHRPAALYASIHQGRHSPSWCCVLTYGLLYVAACFGLYFAGRQPVVAPWIVLDPRHYYLVQAFYALPLTLLLWIQAAGTIHVLSRFFGGKGSFDRILTMTGYSLWAPWFILIPFDAFPVPEPVYDLVLAVCMTWMVAGTVIAAKIEQEVRWPGAVISSVAAIASVAVLMYTFIR